MSSTFVSVNETEKRLLTVRQQIENLKAWNKIQEDRLMQKLRKNENLGVVTSSRGTFTDKPNYVERNIQSKFNGSNFTVQDEQPLIPTHENFESLLNARLEEQNSEFKAENAPNIIKEKKPFLKKGEGLSRFRMKAEDFKLRKRTRTAAKIQPRTNNVSIPTCTKMKNDKSVPFGVQQNENTALEAFEILEQKTNDSSFCSSSSMVAQLMEDSIKSTPIKNNENQFCEKGITLNRNENDHNICGEYDFFGIRSLSVIDEEPSKLEDISKENSNEFSVSRRDGQYNLVIVDVCDSNKYENHSDEEHYDSSECSSKCSCCQNNSQYLSKSVSIFTEETTTLYSPIKNQTVHKINSITSDDAYCDPEIGIDSSENNEGDVLKSLLQLRLRELETEIDAFRSENSHLTKLRRDYEKEYNKFCEEKVQFLAKIRSEHLKGVKELEDEKKKLHREKLSFEKYIKETKNKPNKQEKEEIRLLKEEIKNLKDEMNKKESRWAAAQARIRTEMKQLKDRNADLKEELMEIKNSAKKVTFSSTTKQNKQCYTTNTNNKYDELKTILKDTPKSIVFDTCNSENTMLKDFEFRDSNYVNNIRNFVENSESIRKNPIINNDLCRSICVSSYVNEEKTDDVLTVDDNVDFIQNINDDPDVTESFSSNGHLEKIYRDGRKEIWYTNGNVKKISADGKIIKTIYFNDDVKEVLTESETVKYYYAESKIWHTQYKNGSEVMEFPNGQIEKRFEDGSMEIIYSNGMVYNVDSSGSKKWTLVDGTVIS